MKEKLKEIKNFNDYFISNLGNVYSNKTGTLVKLKPYVDSKGNYLIIRLIRNDGKRKGCLVHRLVAEAFIPNPNKYPEVNHKDKNKQNPNVKNLEWCTRKQNLEDSYLTLPPDRNVVNCELYYKNSFVESFKSIEQAARYAAKEFDVSQTMLSKHLSNKDVFIKVLSGKRKNRKV